MKLIKVKNYEDMSEKVAEMIIEKIRKTSKLNLGLATGGTPKGTYKKLVEAYEKKMISFQQVTTFNLDEYVGLAPNDPNSYHYYMNKSLFDHVDIQPSNTNIPNGVARDLMEECVQYDYLIKKSGGIDLQILGIGQNGHIGFNEPGTSFDSGTHIVKLDDSTINANARYFNRLQDVPTHAITMGIQSILQSKEIILMVSGEEKSNALQRLLNGEVTEEFPASALKNHPNVYIIADEKALSSVFVS
ncbi:glucosamine-6-phosphate deaminase [Anaerobacillus alkalidiazotrophicus]|uniref:Glucosamine-6-phosphate deaminase n=1 Tax=Anaerobacillus alkalidiazotrophicus TaxID=472963 RepID=A0A1S2MCD0_9BACI|nr:glucosamine-6-phosphate deaminase [Anaerobacillus alkalidiazotrophicus]OIJ22391.1 glucosamine-6-phosphate deaminase [Anaerobacillus alkalidiazotrophicus]